MNPRSATTWMLALSLAACSGDTKSTDTDSDDQPAVADTFDTAEEDLPTPGEEAILTIVSPANGDELDPDFEVVWEVNGCDINYPSQDGSACHIHRYLDGNGLDEPITDGFGLYQYVTFDMQGLEPGEHTISIVLIPNDKPGGGGFDDGPHTTPISDAITFMVLAPAEDTDDTDAVDTDALDTVDDDNDSYSEAQGDCNDANPAINPAATDLVGDGFDQNCDGVDGFDGDGDGFASEITGGDDCDDTDASTYPGATDIPNDLIDQDCHGGDADDTDVPDTGDTDTDAGDTDTGDTDAGDTDTDPADSDTDATDTFLGDTAR
jgi:hypothetical protein